MTGWVSLVDARRFVPAAATIPDGALLDGITVASEILTGLSGCQPGEDVFVLGRGCPCAAERYSAGGAGIIGGGLDVAVRGSVAPYWWRITDDGSGDLAVAGAGCGWELALPDNPVLSVTAVTAAGVLVDPATYELRDGHRLRRLSGHWPGLLTVAYVTGGTIGLAGQRAAAILGVELARGALGDDACALPQRVTSVSRQGVSYTILDPQTFLTDGRTGLYDVDVWLASVTRPGAPTSGVLSPDAPRLERGRS